jgi:hypothetical protein
MAATGNAGGTTVDDTSGGLNRGWVSSRLGGRTIRATSVIFAFRLKIEPKGIRGGGGGGIGDAVLAALVGEAAGFKIKGESISFEGADGVGTTGAADVCGVGVAAAIAGKEGAGGGGVKGIAGFAAGAGGRSIFFASGSFVAVERADADLKVGKGGGINRGSVAAGLGGGKMALVGMGVDLVAAGVGAAGGSFGVVVVELTCGDGLAGALLAGVVSGSSRFIM